MSLSLIWLHSLRRLEECLYVSIYSSGVIHVAQYGLGVAYYFLVGITLLDNANLDPKNSKCAREWVGWQGIALWSIHFHQQKDGHFAKVSRYCDFFQLRTNTSNNNVQNKTKQLESRQSHPEDVGTRSLPTFHPIQA